MAKKEFLIMRLIKALALSVLFLLTLTAYVTFIGVPGWAVKPILAYQAEDQIKAHLTDPESAYFRNKDGVCGEVNSKNQLGGYTGFTRYIAGGKYVSLDDNSAEFEDAWQYNCILTDEQRAEVFDRTARHRKDE
jgi:hypothetical protein